jgi:hypothetical protein
MVTLSVEEKPVIFTFFLFIIQIGEKKPEGNFPSVIHEGWEDLTSLKVRH